MARLHGLVEGEDDTATRTALEGLEVHAIAGHEALLVTPFSVVFVGLGRLDGRVRHARLLIRRQYLFVVHDEAVDSRAVGQRGTIERAKDSLGAASFLIAVGISGGDSGTLSSPWGVWLLAARPNRVADARAYCEQAALLHIARARHRAAGY
jgi:hypothetical protein